MQYTFFFFYNDEKLAVNFSIMQVKDSGRSLVEIQTFQRCVLHKLIS